MSVFAATVNHPGFLLLFFVLGYLLSWAKLIPGDTQSALSKPENFIFIPALVLDTFMGNFTTETLSIAWKILLNNL